MQRTTRVPPTTGSAVARPRRRTAYAGALALLLVGAPGAHAFAPADRAALLVARDAWCADPTAAAATYGTISTWDVSAVTDMSWVFCAKSISAVHEDFQSYGCNPACANFNDPLDGWNTSSVTTMERMFFGASAFNQALTFDTSSVTDMTHMFRETSAFNQALTFDTSSVTTMRYMFGVASAFNQALTFDTSSVTDMTAMFWSASAFNQALTFDTSSVTDMWYMFDGTSLNDCNKALIHAAFSSNSAWPSDYTWGGYNCPLPTPPAPPKPPPPSAPPALTSFYISGERSQLVMGPSSECTLEVSPGATPSITSTCPIQQPAGGRRLSPEAEADVTALAAAVARLSSEVAQLKAENAAIKAQLKAEVKVESA